MFVHSLPACEIRPDIRYCRIGGIKVVVFCFPLGQTQRPC